MIDYKKYRWFFTKSGKLIVGGKSAKSNDSLISELKGLRKELIMMHTKSPGSPFCAILAPINAVSEDDIQECAVFTGCFSRAWKEGKKMTEVHSFKLSQLNKSNDMAEGTWGVSGKVKDFNVELKLAVTKQNELIRTVPINSVAEEEIISIVVPGKVDKTEIKIPLKVNKEELISALPAGGVKFL